MLTLTRYSVGVEAHVGQQATAQLRAFRMATEHGVHVVPIWGRGGGVAAAGGSPTGLTRAAAEAAVRELGWSRPYFVAAEFDRPEAVEGSLADYNFLTLDVAERIGQPAAPDSIAAFMAKHAELIGELDLPGAADPIPVTQATLELVGRRYLRAVQLAGAIYRAIEAAKGEGTFITEVALDKTDGPLAAAELLLVLAALADEGVPVQTIAPKLPGRFHRGADYVGDLARFEREVRDHLAVIAFAVKRYDLPRSLKLSIPTGGDKFSLYPVLRRAMRDAETGLHLKTDGCLWLDTLTGLAESGGEGLALAREIYTLTLAEKDRLAAGDAAVRDIPTDRLPTVGEVNGWTAERFVAALRHDPQNPDFNPAFRELLGVSWSVAVRLGERLPAGIAACQEAIARHVTTNLYERHLKPLFVDP